MRPKIGIRSIKLQLKYCDYIFTYSKPKLFHVGGGSYQYFGFPELSTRQKHFYFWKWCYLSIHSVEKTNYLSKQWKSLNDV